MNKSFFISLIMVLIIAQLYVSAKHLKKPGQTVSFQLLKIIFLIY